MAGGVSLVGALGLVALTALPDGVERLTALAVGGALLTALLAAPYLGGATTLRGLAARAAWGIRNIPGLRLWP
jgi:hypothetical protein